MNADLFKHMMAIRSPILEQTHVVHRQPEGWQSSFQQHVMVAVGRSAQQKVSATSWVEQQASSSV